MKEDLRRLEDELAAAEAARDELLAEGAEPAARVRSRRGDRGGGRGRSRRRRSAAARRAEGAPRARALRHGARGARLRLALRLSRRRHGAALPGALPLGARSRGRRGVHARPPARARPRGGHVRHGLLPGREERVLRDRRGRPLPHGHLGGRARGPAHGRDPGGGRAAAPLHGVLDELQARGGRRRARHPRDVPRPPVQQGGDVRVHGAGGFLGRVRAHPRAGGGRTCRSSACPTGC